MAYRFKNTLSDDEGALCRDVADARHKLDGFIDSCKGKKYKVEEHHVVGNEYPSYLVHDHTGLLVGDFTITSD